MMYNDTWGGNEAEHAPGRWAKPLCGVRTFPPYSTFSGRKERNMEEVVQIVTSLTSNVGFPIACVVAMFYMLNKEREAHMAESAASVEALNRNPDVMQKVLEKLGV